MVLFNHGDEDFHVQVGDRIAQIIIQRIMDFSLTEAIQQTPRGVNGFGSTCVNGFNSTDAINLNAETSSVNHMETDDLLLIDTPCDSVIYSCTRSYKNNLSVNVVTRNKYYTLYVT